MSQMSNFQGHSSGQVSKGRGRKGDKNGSLNMTMGNLLGGKKMFENKSKSKNSLFMMKSINSSSKIKDIFEDYQNRKNLKVQSSNFSIELKKEDLRKMVRHFFNCHLIDDQAMGFHLKLIKIFFTFKILKNAYFAHFLMFNFQDEQNKDNLITINQKLLN